MFGRFALFRGRRRRYARIMSIGHPGGASTLKAIPRLPELDSYVGKWVAVKAGKVVAVAGSSKELAREIVALGADGKGAVMQFVRPEAETFIVGVG